MASAASYQAVVFADGRGTRMPSLSEQLPKALLPVANLPLYWYPLNMLNRAGITDCLLVVPNDQRVNIEKALNDDVCQLPPLSGLHIECVSLENRADDGNEDDFVEEWGTADVAKHLQSKLHKENILLVSGDLVSDVQLDGLLHLHARYHSTLTCLLTESALGGPVPGTMERAANKKFRDFVLLSPKDDQLLYLVDEDDYADEEGIPATLFSRSVHMIATARYKDVHVYAVRRKELLEVLNNKSATGIEYGSGASIKADLIPQILQRMHNKCFAWIPSKNDFSLIAQCNNVGAYFEANKAVQKVLPKICSKFLDTHVPSDKGTVKTTDSWLGDNIELMEGCSVKRSVLGKGCKVGRKARVDNSVLMANVLIEDGVFVKNSIVFDNARIGEKADISMCIIGPHQDVAAKSKFANMTITEKKMMNLLDD